MSGFDLDASTLRSALAAAIRLAETWADLPSNKVRELVRSIVETVEIQDEKIVIALKRNEIASVLFGNAVSGAVIGVRHIRTVHRSQAAACRQGHPIGGRWRDYRETQRTDGGFDARRACNTCCAYDRP